MKYSKAAAVVAGSLVALGAASIASTAHAAEPVPGGQTNTGQSSQVAQPSDAVSRLAGQKLISKVTGQANGVLGKAQQSAQQASSGKALGGAASSLGGLPVTG